MSWQDYVRKYVWDDQKTPYFTGVAKLSRRQADKEIFSYTVLAGFLFLLLAVLTYPETPGDFIGLAASAYAFTAFGAIVALGMTKHLYAALFGVSVPIAAYLILAEVSPQENIHTIDRIFLLVLALLWLRYSLRIVAIARAYPSMTNPEPPGE
jgi:hypothetical protein